MIGLYGKIKPPGLVPKLEEFRSKMGDTKVQRPPHTLSHSGYLFRHTRDHSRALYPLQFFMIGLGITAVLLLLGLMAAGIGIFYWGPGCDLAALLFVLVSMLLLHLAPKAAPVAPVR